MGIGGQKSKQVIKGKEKNSSYTGMEKKEKSLFVLTLQHQLRGLGNSMSKRIPQS